MKNTIEVNGIRLYGYHGCLPEEGDIGGHYVVDVRITTNFMDAFLSDNIKDTVDYVAINKVVKEEMAIRSKLIEHVGYRILERFRKEIEGIQTAHIKVIKNCPPIEGDVENVAIIIEDTF